eukprot:CAMPEP_0114445204 /NCGR_PEP_ID=MMETSP0103-20121206/18498_1 /TAXON_ID=37642 ORGANISM="Paraphysomonas imperforata, Strain PA2" /NCGR_SAMPLE_ID=MMETSP0103 /ASSEMBLY_ACC=CAM_ASM_000201 /LENGTH=458 /DNA_ID=CAMNT_0001616799 /DNA_START=134 /DNA_END=1507 /DNA_ORIENTATION=-
MKRLTVSNVADKDLLSSTNKLLSHVGITAKQIISINELTRVASSMFVAVFESINELTRVASSMFVAVFEALFRTRVEGVVRRPKGTRDYISNCQVILDSLSRQLQMDLRHITGESIFQGDRRALSNLVNILLRIATITGKSNGQEDMKQFGRSKGSESISSHESAFAHMEEERLAGEDTEQRDFEFLGSENGPVLEEPATDDAHMWGMPLVAGAHLGPPEVHAHHDEPPPFNVATSPDFGRQTRRSSSGYVGMEDKLDMENLKSSLSEFEQHKKVEAARQRRESHLQNKVCQASIRNTSTAKKTFEVFQQQWVEDNTRDEYANLLRRKHSEQVMLRKVQKGILKHLREGQLDQSLEARERIQEIKKEARWHFQSLQNLFDDRVKTLRSQEMDLRQSQEEDVGSYKRLHDQLRQFNALKQKKALQDNKIMLQQKRLYSAQMRQDSHQQLLSYLAAGEAW